MKLVIGSGPANVVARSLMMAISPSLPVKDPMVAGPTKKFPVVPGLGTKPGNVKKSIEGLIGVPVRLNAPPVAPKFPTTGVAWVTVTPLKQRTIKSRGLRASLVRLDIASPLLDEWNFGIKAVTSAQRLDYESNPFGKAFGMRALWVAVSRRMKKTSKSKTSTPIGVRSSKELVFLAPLGF